MTSKALLLPALLVSALFATPAAAEPVSINAFLPTGYGAPTYFMKVDDNEPLYKIRLLLSEKLGVSFERIKFSMLAPVKKQFDDYQLKLRDSDFRGNVALKVTVE